ncbi:MAG: c-type cytochrome [Acidobacteriota bacterium]|nr:c-type cytochrome [Acidobacteriota bacterium]
MAKPPKKAPDRHYDFKGLNIAFAWSSLALLIVTVWMMFADYAKPWKRFQAEFRDRERQALLAEARTERETINQDKLQQLEQDIASEEQALAEQRGEIRDLEKQRTGFAKKVYAADADSRQTKSLLDTARYTYDVAVQSGVAERVTKARTTVDELAAQLVENRIRLEQLIEAREGTEESLEAKRAGLAAAEKRLEALNSGVDSLNDRIANLDKKIDYFVLNAPVMDFVQPSLKIEQVILSGLYQNINFTNVDRVDRCVTCHIAAPRSGFDGEEWEEPLRSHPRLDLYLSAASPHPYTKFGCTTCHQGLDRATDFSRAGHTPENEHQREEWIRKWGWKPQKFLDTPILPGRYTEAGCVECHADDVWTPNSQLQDVGLDLVNRFGCFTCHVIDYPALTDLPRPGPTLRRVASKTNPAWAYRWIEAPRDFHPSTWMPHFFYQENIEGELNLERQKAEIASVVAYIWDNSERPTYPDPPAGDVASGKALYESVGCEGCHVLDPQAKRDQFYPVFNRMNGPNLVRTGSKVSAGWLYAWIKDPKKYYANTRMPSLRLTDQEAADLTAFLMSSRDPKFEGLSMPSVDPEVRDALALDYLQANQTIEQSQASLEGMDDHARDVYLGGLTIRKYGCFGCHELDGFDDAKPIGVELTEEGSKPVHQFDFGHVHEVAYRSDRLTPAAETEQSKADESGHSVESAQSTDAPADSTTVRHIEHTRADWMFTKLMRPRVWDQGKERVKNYGELYRMPDFGMTQREAEAVLVNVLGFTRESVLAHRKAGQGPEAAAVAEGRKLVTWYNCQGCHLIEDRGHAIATAIEDVGLLPPNLAAEGARVQGDWLFGYLHDPGSVTMRPWLGTRMPTFGFTDEQVNTMVAYFSNREGRETFLSQPERPSERSLTVGKQAFEMLQCAKCHPAGPSVAVAGTSSAELAPSLLLARERLRHDWVPDWILDPQSWIAGTKMPANFPPQQDGSYMSPLPFGIDAPMWRGQKDRMLRQFGTEPELKEFLADADQVAVALRDHIWWNLDR